MGKTVSLVPCSQPCGPDSGLGRQRTVFTAIAHGPLASGRRPQPPASQTATSLLASSPGVGCLCCLEGPSRGHPQDSPSSLLPSLDDHSASATVFTTPDSPAGSWSEAVWALLRTRRPGRALPWPPKPFATLRIPAPTPPRAQQSGFTFVGRVLSPRYLPLQACSLSTLLPRAPGWAWPPDLQALCCCCSIAQSRPTLGDPTDCSTPGLPVLHHLPELAQTPVHQVGDAVQHAKAGAIRLTFSSGLCVTPHLL